MAAGPDARHDSERPLGTVGFGDAGLGPISPELALIDPELARQARRLLPEPQERPRPPQSLRERPAPEPAAEPEARRPRRWARTLALAIVIFAAGAASGSFLGNRDTRSPGSRLEVRASAPAASRSTETHPLRPPVVAPARTPTSTARRRQRRRPAPTAWASNVLGVQTIVSRHGVALLWRTPADSARVVVLRQRGARPSSVVYRGRAMTYRDGAVRPCTGYRYTIVNYDRRGHRSTGVPTSVVTRCA
jgi:hypothetical protein